MLLNTIITSRIDLYRVAYDSENYRLISEQLMVDHRRILDNNRAQLLDDAFVLASVHMLPYKSALDLSLYLKYEKEYVPWNAVLSELGYIDSMLYNQPQFSHWNVCIAYFFFSLNFVMSFWTCFLVTESHD